MTKIIKFSQVNDLNILPSDTVDWVNEALKVKYDSIMPAKTSMKPSEQVFFNVMPTVVPSMNVAGVKVVSRFPGRVPTLESQIMLYDLETGVLKAILDGNVITTMRTGAVAAHTIKLLAKSQFSSIGFVGLGNQARATAKALFSLFPNRNFNISLVKYKQQGIEFEKYLKSFPNSKRFNINFVDNVPDLFLSNDVIVSSVTYAENDFLKNESEMKPGTLVVPIHTRGFMNLDAAVDSVYCDDTSQIRGFKYFEQMKNVTEVSQVVLDPSLGRQNNLQRILAYNIGIALHDIYFAEKIYQLVAETNTDEIDLENPKMKLWYE